MDKQDQLAGKLAVHYNGKMLEESEQYNSKINDF